MPTPEKPTWDERYYTVTASAGNLLISCFLASRTFTNRPAQLEMPDFTEEHIHSSYELLICRKGQGFQFINGHAYRYEPGSIFVMAPFIKHANISSGQGEWRHSIRFELPQNRGDLPAYMEEALRQLKHDGCFRFSADDMMLSMLDALAKTVQRNEPHVELLLGGILSTIFSCVFYNLCWLCSKNGGGGGEAPLQEDPSRRKFLLDYYFDHLMYSDADDDVKMDDICRQLHLSPSQLNRVLKETYGTTFKKKSIEVRLAYIKYYLKYTTLTVSEIASRTKFASDSNFSLFFKQHTGLSPTQFRLTECVAEQAEAPWEVES